MVYLKDLITNHTLDTKTSQILAKNNPRINLDNHEITTTKNNDIITIENQKTRRDNGEDTARVDLQQFIVIYSKLLDLCPLNDLAKKYLEKRGFDLDFIASQKIGFLDVKNYSLIQNTLLKHFSLDLLIKSGLFSSQGKFKGYDVFSLNSKEYFSFGNCLILPYLDKKMNPFYLQFRVLTNLNKKPKYIFLKGIKQPIFNKDLVLDLLLNQPLPTKTNLYFFEGVFDCLALYNSHFDYKNELNLGISLGSVSSVKKDTLLEILNPIKDLLKYKKLSLVLAFDSDTAGQKATLDFTNLVFDLFDFEFDLSSLDLKGFKDFNSYLSE